MTTESYLKSIMREMKGTFPVGCKTDWERYQEICRRIRQHRIEKRTILSNYESLVDDFNTIKRQDSFPFDGEYSHEEDYKM